MRAWLSRLLVISAFVAAPSAEVIDRIMAVVGNQPITLSDLNAGILFRFVDVPAGTRDPLAFALDRLIERNLILTEVDRFQPPEPPLEERFEQAEG